MGIGILENIESEVTTAVKNLSEKCPICSDIIKYLATQENKGAYLGDLAKEIGFAEDSEKYIDAINYLEVQNILYDLSDFVGLTDFGSGIEKILTYLEETRN